MTQPAFVFDPRLAEDTHPCTKFMLCDVRIMDDARFKWLVLVPRITNAVEIFDLREQDQLALNKEIAIAAKALKELTKCQKINIAAFGNIVSQLHIHIIARHQTDAAWPASAVGLDGKIKLKNNELESFSREIQQYFDD